MLRVGSVVTINDNSGDYVIRIVNLKYKKLFVTTYITLSNIVLGVVRSLDVNKKSKVKSKDFVNCIIVAIKKKYSKKNGLFIRFSANQCIVLKITRFIVPIASYVESVIFYELRFLRKFKVVFKSTSNVF